MRWRSAESRLTEELEAAMQEYCAALTEMADDAARGQALSAEQVGRAAEAGLRLENASTLFELYSCRRRRAAQGPELLRTH